MTKRSHCSHPSHTRLLSVLQKERNKDSLILESNTSSLNEIFETNLTSFLSQINENWANRLATQNTLSRTEGGEKL